jgi:hypothetical protein
MQFLGQTRYPIPLNNMGQGTALVKMQDLATTINLHVKKRTATSHAKPDNLSKSRLAVNCVLGFLVCKSSARLAKKLQRLG